LYWKIRKLERVGSGSNHAESANQSSVIGSAQPFWGRLILSTISSLKDPETSADAAPGNGEGRLDGNQTAAHSDPASGPRGSKNPGARQAVCLAFLYPRLSAGRPARTGRHRRGR